MMNDPHIQAQLNAKNGSVLNRWRNKNGWNVVIFAAFILSE